MKKIIAIFAGLALLVGLSACDSQGEDKQRKAIEAKSSKATEQQIKAEPYPAEQLRNSLERKNLRKRLIRQAKANKIGYVYYVPFGKILGYWVIKGKVSSTQSQMNPEDDVIKFVCPGSCADSAGPVSSAGDDGSYGENEAGVFFFTADTDTMIQVPEDDYFYSDQPVTLGGENIPELVK